MNISIRKAAEQDFEKVFLLIKEFSLFQKTPEKLFITPEQMIQDKDMFQCLVAVNDDENFVGCASYFFTYYSWSGKGLYLDDLYVQPSFRKQQIGKKLFDAVIEIARKENCRRMRWLVSGWNKNAIDFYKKIGAVVDSTDMNCELLLHDKN
ncbi:MAG: GNAT family N-acetyltransferase [Bacteroidota bacterium]|nr:GNAT family N-acetyltransferase [Bacteroidota bacterium]